MDWPHCHDCEAQALYQCCRDKHYLCSNHHREFHLRHKYVSIAGEVQRRQALAQVLQRDLHILEQGLQVGEGMITKSVSQAEASVQAWTETLEEWLAVHRTQLEALRTLAANGQSCELYEALLARLRCNFSDPLLRLSVHLPS